MAAESRAGRAPPRGARLRRALPRPPRPSLAALALLALLAPALAGCVAPGADPDGDGLDTPAELTPRDILLRTREGPVHRSVTSDPQLADTDGDGLTDGQEVELHTDPRDVDSDGDGLLDGHDLPADTPLAAQLLARGVVRAANGTFLGELDAGTSPFDWDSDQPLGDGLGDGDELRGWDVALAGRTYHVTSDPRLPDTDRDGLSDRLERGRGCDPRRADTDGDGTPDAVDSDCARNVRLVIGLPRLRLAHDMDPQGGANLLVEVNTTGGLSRALRRDVATGENNLSLAWDADVPDDGPWHALVVPVLLTFWDEDLAGNDAQSGVQRQPLRLTEACANPPLCNAVQVQFGVFTRTWTTGDAAGSGDVALRGPDGDATLRFTPRLV